MGCYPRAIRSGIAPASVARAERTGRYAEFLPKGAGEALRGREPDQLSDFGHRVVRFDEYARRLLDTKVRDHLSDCSPGHRPPDAVKVIGRNRRSLGEFAQRRRLIKPRA